MVGVSLIPGSSVVGVSLTPGSSVIGVPLLPGSSAIGVSLVPCSSIVSVALVPCVSLLPTCCLFVTEEPSSVSPSTALETFSWVSRTIAAIVVHSSSEDQLDSDILLPETNEYEVYYFD